MNLPALLIVATLAFVTAIQAKSVTIGLKVEEEVADGEGGVEKRSYDGELLLEERLIELHSPELSIQWDFLKKAVSLQKGKDAAAETLPLYGALSTRLVEYEKAKAMLTVPSTVTPQTIDAQAGGRQIFLEHSFALRDGGRVVMDKNNKDGFVSYSYNQSPLLNFSQTGEVVDPWTMERLVMFIRHCYGGHPQILRELQSLNYIPQEIVIWKYGGGEKTVWLRFGKIGGSEKSPKKVFRTEEVANAKWDKDELADLESTVSSWKDGESTRRVKAMRSSLQAALREKRHLEAFTLSLALAIATGEKPDDTGQEWEEIVEDKSVKSLLSALDAKSKSEILKSVDTLKELQSKAGAGRVSLGVLAANLYGKIGDYDNSIGFMLQALEKEPALAGAWKDLGDDYHELLDVQSAWRCYRVARGLNPTGEVGQNIDALETWIGDKCADFFLPEPVVAAEDKKQGA
jgi:tetratricopeptide (TPR) repeat protein